MSTIVILQTEKVRRKKTCEKTMEQVAEQTTALRMQKKATSSLSQKILVLQKLKSLKEAPETIRKIEFNMINIDYKGKQLNVITCLELKWLNL